MQTAAYSARELRIEENVEPTKVVIDVKVPKQVKKELQVEERKGNQMP